ncbi:hypothetical protein [Aeromicrobium sp. 179-A 4D2 NHS]|uniref:hypothetical protein n=1 Tax=Aeromicrobium sp. 179-A 4D2 NHS TaxID=3142375 RepID=UPI00399F930A
MTSNAATIARHEALLDFHRTFGHPINERLLETSTIELRRSLIAEEISELLTAIRDVDLVEVADALTDIIYIAEGTAVAYGRTINPAFHQFVPVEDTIGFPNSDVTGALLSHMDHLYGEYVTAALAGGAARGAVADTLEQIVDLCLCAGARFGFDMDALFTEVHRSNMAKVGPDGQVIRREDGKVLKPEGWTAPDIESVLWG